VRIVDVRRLCGICRAENAQRPTQDKPGPNLQDAAPPERRTGDQRQAGALGKARAARLGGHEGFRQAIKAIGIQSRLLG